MYELPADVASLSYRTPLSSGRETRSVLDIIRGPGDLEVFFQPIFEVREPRVSLHGLEALVRGRSSTGLESAELLFARARREGVAAELDRTCLRAIFAALDGVSVPLGVNVHASTLGGDRDFPAFLFRLAEAHGVDLSRVTVEIIEQSRPLDDAVLQSTLKALRAAGVSIALDDVGLGHSNYRMMLDCAPDFLKVDRYLVMGCDEDLRRRAILDSVFLLGARLGARMVAEGVESVHELRILAGLGVELFQGFLFSRPLSAEELGRNGDLGGRVALLFPDGPQTLSASSF